MVSAAVPRQRSIVETFGTWNVNKALLRRLRMDLRETDWQCVDWMHLAQDREQWRDVVNTVMNLRVL
jgi:hypothetical protein